MTESLGNGRGRGRESLRYEGHIGLRFSACFPSAVGLPSVRRLPFRHPIDSVSHPYTLQISLGEGEKLGKHAVPRIRPSLTFKGHPSGWYRRTLFVPEGNNTIHPPFPPRVGADLPHVRSCAACSARAGAECGRGHATPFLSLTCVWASCGRGLLSARTALQIQHTIWFYIFWWFISILPELARAYFTPSMLML